MQFKTGLLTWCASLLSSPFLRHLQSMLTKQQNDFKIKLKELEDSLLHRLSSAEGNILSDTALVDNLETTKRTAATIAEQVEEAKKTEAQINTARELYRPAATRAAMLYFILNDLNKINPLYQFSLKVSHFARHNTVLLFLLLDKIMQGWTSDVFQKAVALCCSCVSLDVYLGVFVLCLTVSTIIGLYCGVPHCYQEGRQE